MAGTTTCFCAHYPFWQRLLSESSRLGSQKGYCAINSTQLPPELIASFTHPPINGRPAKWSSLDAISFYVDTVLSRIFKDKPKQLQTELSKLIRACYALVAHPVHRLESIGPD